MEEILVAFDPSVGVMLKELTEHGPTREGTLAATNGRMASLNCHV